MNQFCNFFHPTADLCHHHVNVVCVLSWPAPSDMQVPPPWFLSWHPPQKVKTHTLSSSFTFYNPSIFSVKNQNSNICLFALILFHAMALQVKMLSILKWNYHAYRYMFCGIFCHKWVELTLMSKIYNKPSGVWTSMWHCKDMTDGSRINEGTYRSVSYVSNFLGAGE